MKRLADVARSVLDLAPIVEGGTAAEALARSRDLAQHVEKWGFKRFWLAEHHNMPGIASAATSVVIGHVAQGTSTIRVGSGGIMLSNHAPLMVAEQFGTLESLYPGRIDLGLGRAPGTDQETVRLLRRGLHSTGDEFPGQLAELTSFLERASPEQRVRAVPGAGMRIPIWLLGSSGFSAQLAGQLGLPFAVAGHFSPDNMHSSLELYRRSFVPSTTLPESYAMVCVNIFAADTETEALRLATSQLQARRNLAVGRPQPLPPPADPVEWPPEERDYPGTIIGSASMVHERLKELVEETEADEIMVHAMIYDHAARLRSYQIVHEAWT
jgi:luciferase family oxidoreductase group 1